jgi:hypothetical protein
MAKSVRSKAQRKARAELRTAVFGPVEDTRRQRLAQKVTEELGKQMALEQQVPEAESELCMMAPEAKAHEASAMDLDPKRKGKKGKLAAPSGIKKKKGRKEKKPFNFYGI